MPPTLARADTVVVLGDSLTDAAGPTGSWLTRFAASTVPAAFGPRFTASSAGGSASSASPLLGGRTAVGWDASVGAVPTFLNSGVSGLDTGEAIAQLPALVHAKVFNKIWINLGVNDTLTFQGGDATRNTAYTTASVDTILDDLRGTYPTTEIVWISPVCIGENWPQGANAWDADLDSRCTIIEAACATYDVFYVDMRGPYFAYQSVYNTGHAAFGYSPGGLTGDNVHLTAGPGHSFMCDTVMSAMTVVR